MQTCFACRAAQLRSTCVVARSLAPTGLYLHVWHGLRLSALVDRKHSPTAVERHIAPTSPSHRAGRRQMIRSLQLSSTRIPTPLVVVNSLCPLPMYSRLDPVLFCCCSIDGAHASAATGGTFPDVPHVAHFFPPFASPAPPIPPLTLSLPPCPISCSGNQSPRS